MKPLPFRTDAAIADAVPRAVAHLRAGGLLGYPTETVYGLGSRPLAPDVERLRRLKGRPAGKPLLLLVNGLPMVETYGLVLTPAARTLAAAHWPGPLTLVLRGGEGGLPDELRGPEGGIAVRWTSHAGIARVIDALGMPLTSTSANQPGRPTAPGAAALVSEFPTAVADGTLLVLDGGVLGSTPPSTLVDCTHEPPRMLRDGAIPRRELALGP